MKKIYWIISLFIIAGCGQEDSLGLDDDSLELYNDIYEVKKKLIIDHDSKSFLGGISDLKSKYNGKDVSISVTPHVMGFSGSLYIRNNGEKGFVAGGEEQQVQGYDFKNSICFNLKNRNKDKSILIWNDFSFFDKSLMNEINTLKEKFYKIFDRPNDPSLSDVIDGNVFKVGRPSILDNEFTVIINGLPFSNDKVSDALKQIYTNDSEHLSRLVVYDGFDEYYEWIASEYSNLEIPSKIETWERFFTDSLNMSEDTLKKYFYSDFFTNSGDTIFYDLEVKDGTEFVSSRNYELRDVKRTIKMDLIELRKDSFLLYEMSAIFDTVLRNNNKEVKNIVQEEDNVFLKGVYEYEYKDVFQTWALIDANIIGMQKRNFSNNSNLGVNLRDDFYFDVDVSSSILKPLYPKSLKKFIENNMLDIENEKKLLSEKISKLSLIIMDIEDQIDLIKDFENEILTRILKVKEIEVNGYDSERDAFFKIKEEI